MSRSVFRKIFLSAAVSVSALLSACKAQTLTPPPPNRTPTIVVDQFGYLPEMRKYAVIRQPVEGFDAVATLDNSLNFGVLDLETDAIVLKMAATPWNEGGVDPNSGDKAWHVDFSELRVVGRYKIIDIDKHNGRDGYESAPFSIAEDVYTPVLKTAFKTLYYQRAGFAKTAPYAQEGYRDGASHIGPGQDGEARLFSAKDDASTARDLRGGWYDAGDYNKYTSWTARYITSLLHMYLERPTVWGDDFDIPESGNGIPDILDEVKWGLDWLERMQNEDGSMLSVMSLSEASPPSAAEGPSFYGPANTSATLHSAGTFAMAASVLGQRAAFSADAKRYAERSETAWRWAMDNPDVIFKNNDAEYNSERLAAGQQEVDDKGRQTKKMVSAAYRYVLTGEAEYAQTVARLYPQTKPINPYAANGYRAETIFSLLWFARQKGVPAELSKTILADFKSSIETSGDGRAALVGEVDPYRAPIAAYTWGSSSVKARYGSHYTQLIAAGLSKDAAADRNNAAGYLHYLHGINPLGKVYLTNMSELGATHSVTSLYHAWFVDGSEDYDSTESSTYGPVPGLVVGGPNPSYARDDCCKTVCGGYGAKICERPAIVPPEGQPPAKSYSDFNDGWPLNSWEVTENSNAYQLAYLQLLSKFAG